MKSSGITASEGSYQRIWISFSLICRCVGPLLCFILLSGFTFPSSHELRREFKAELKKIKDSTPGAKALANWNRSRDAARESIREAEISGAPDFAQDEYAEAVDLYSRAAAYAAERSYRKASYLAQKSAEIASLASENAGRAREKIEKQQLKKLESLKKKLDAIHEALPIDSEWEEPLADMFLKWADIRNALSMGQYEEADREMRILERQITNFRTKSGVVIDDSAEKWEETI